MQQVSEANQSAGDAPVAPVPSVETLDTSNLVTDAAAAARQCPDCDALMERTEPDGSDPHETEDKPYLRCPACDRCEPLPAAAPAVEPQTLACETCGLVVVVQPLSSGHGFKLIAIERDVAGVDMATSFGSSPNGFPICPKDGVAMIPQGPVPVGEAFKGIADALQDASTPAGQMRLPHTSPPFNVAEALDSIERKNREVDQARRIYAVKKEAAADAKKDLDLQESELGRLITEIARRRHEYELAARGRLSGQNAPCLYERRAAKPCPTCRTDVAKAKESGVEAEELRLVSIGRHLAHRGSHLEDDEIDALAEEAPETLAALEAWAHDETVKLVDVAALSALVQRSCIAGPNGEHGQHCTRCGVALHNHIDEQEAGATPYPEGDYVGLDCDGASGEQTADGDAPEPARTLPKRHKTAGAAAAAKSKAARAAKAEKPAKGTKAKAKKPKGSGT